MQGNSTHFIGFTQPNSIHPAAANPTANVTTLLVIIFPAVVILSVVSYRYYCVARLRQQIATLEKLWQLTSSQKLF